MFGLDDEYGDADEKVDHSKIVEDEGGGKVVRGDDGRVMSGGEHVGTRTARRSSRSSEMTKIDWGNAPKSPTKPIPAGADADGRLPGAGAAAARRRRPGLSRALRTWAAARAASRGRACGPAGAGGRAR